MPMRKRNVSVIGPSRLTIAFTRPFSAAGQLHLAVLLGARPLGDVVDRASEGVAAVERRLRALHHFHALEVVQFQVYPGLAAEVDAIEEDADVELAEGLRRAADDGQLVLRAEQRRVVQAGRQLADVGQSLDARALQLLGGEGVDGDRRVLQRLVALAGGDGHLAHRVRIGRDLGVGGRGRGRGGGALGGGLREGGGRACQKSPHRHGKRQRAARRTHHLVVPHPVESPGWYIVMSFATAREAPLGRRRVMKTGVWRLSQPWP